MSPTEHKYTPLISRLDACAPLILNSDVLDQELKDKLKAQMALYAASLTDLSEGRLKENDEGVSEMLDVIPRFCLVIEMELGDA